jgi:hypothetical protein
MILVDVVRTRGEMKSVSPLDSITFDPGDDVSPADCLKLTEAGIKISPDPPKIS